MEQKLNREKGQHLLTNEEALEAFEKSVNPGGIVIEVGSGSGNITKRIAKFAKRVIGYEPDKRFEDNLSQIQREHPNVEVNYKDILGVDLKKQLRHKSRDERYQIMSNLPFQISEPFLKKIIDLPIDEAVLILGEQMARRIQTENPDNLEFGRTGAMVQTFFDTSIAKKLGRDSFSPAPSTDSVLAVLTPKDPDEMRSNPKTSILGRLFKTEDSHSPTGNVIKEAIDALDSGSKQRGKEERNRYDRRQTRQELRQAVQRGDFDLQQRKAFKSRGQRDLEKLGLSEEILNKPFSNLDNQELRDLVTALEKKYGK